MTDFKPCNCQMCIENQVDMGFLLSGLAISNLRVSALMAKVKRSEMDIEKQVAEAKCPVDAELNYASHMLGCRCGGTMLAWPSLSRECEQPDHDECKVCDNIYEDGHECCNGSGRVPDVTLEKVLPILIADDRWIELDSGAPIQPSDWTLNLWTIKKHEYFHGTTPLEAACSALLATVSGTISGKEDLCNCWTGEEDRHQDWCLTGKEEVMGTVTHADVPTTET